MTADYDVVTEEQKEHCALTTMRQMLTQYAKEENIPFDTAMLTFAQTPVYEVLFDYASELWKEGPVYLKSYYREYLRNTKG